MRTQSHCRALYSLQPAQSTLAAKLRGTFGLHMAEGGSGSSILLPLRNRVSLPYLHYMTKLHGIEQFTKCTSKNKQEF